MHRLGGVGGGGETAIPRHLRFRSYDTRSALNGRAQRVKTPWVLMLFPPFPASTLLLCCPCRNPCYITIALLLLCYMQDDEEEASVESLPAPVVPSKNEIELQSRYGYRSVLRCSCCSIVVAAVRRCCCCCCC